MAKKAVRVLVKVTDPGLVPGLAMGDQLFITDGVVERDSPAPIVAEVIAAAWPLIVSRQAAFAAGDYTPAKGQTSRGVFIVVQVAPEEQQTKARTKRFEGSAVESQREAAARGVSSFRDRLPSALVQSLRRISEERSYLPGEDIIVQGTAASCLYLVDDGEVEVVRVGNEEEAVLVILGSGEVFGEMSILTGEPTSATVRARTFCSVWAVTKDELEELLSRTPLLGREFSRLLATRMRMSNQSVEQGLDKSIFGSLTMVDPSDLVQTMNASRRTGRLTLTRGRDSGNMTFENGRLTGADLGNIRGRDALLQLLRWRTGNFAFERGEFPPVGPLEGDTMAILMDSMRQIDEDSRGPE